MEKIDMKIKNDINLKYISTNYPNAITYFNGQPKIDFDILKQELGELTDIQSKEKYQLTWPGKKECLIKINESSTNTLRPLLDKSNKFYDTKNIYIEGDNLEVLKLLQESYLNKIKCIYIDPPYNTGNDFIYNDNCTKFLTKSLLLLIKNIAK